VLAVFTEKFGWLKRCLIVFGDCLLADRSRIELLNSGMAYLFCSH